jgi:hypothetical protein
LIVVEGVAPAQPGAGTIVDLRVDRSLSAIWHNSWTPLTPSPVSTVPSTN